VSRTSDLSAAAAGSKAAWSSPVAVNQAGEAATTGSDKEWIWVDDAASSPHFGTVYVCFTRALPPYTNPMSIVCSRSADGGVSFSTPIVVNETNAAIQFRVGAQIATDSNGIVYVVYAEVRSGQYQQVMTHSLNGGLSYDTPRLVSNVTPIGQADTLLGTSSFFDKALDGRAGSRVFPMPSLTIANGAPTGMDAPNTIAVGCSDGRAGANQEDSLAVFSSDGANTFTLPAVVSDTADRAMMTAVALSPDGQDFYVAYNAVTAAFQTTTTNPRPTLGVVRHAGMVGGTPAGRATLSRGSSGDARASARNNSTVSGFLGDYIGIQATNTGATAVHVDARRAVACPAMNTYRQKRINGQNASAPSPNTACAAGFGNTDIYASSVLAPFTFGLAR